MAGKKDARCQKSTLYTLKLLKLHYTAGILHLNDFKPSTKRIVARDTDIAIYTYNV